MKAVLLFSCINCYCILVRMPQNKKGALLFIIFLQSWVRRDKICQRNLTKTEIGSKVDRKLPSWLHSMQGGDRNALSPGGLAWVPGVPLGQGSLQTGAGAGLHGWEVATLPGEPRLLWNLGGQHLGTRKVSNESSTHYARAHSRTPPAPSSYF